MGVEQTGQARIGMNRTGKAGKVRHDGDRREMERQDSAWQAWIGLERNGEMRREAER